MLLCLTAFFIVTRGVPGCGEFLILFIVMLACPVVNIIALWDSKIVPTPTWLALYFKRKALEEEKKIEALEKEDE